MHPLRLQTVLVADDLTPASEGALRTGAALRDNAGATLHVAHVASGSEGIVAAGGKRAEALYAMRQSAERAGIGDDHSPHLVVGSPAEAIGALAERLEADVIITGHRQWNPTLARRQAIGGTAYSIITRSAVPCLVLSEPLQIPLATTVVGVDASPASRGALLAGLSWASALRARRSDSAALTALYVHPDREAPQAAKQRVAEELELLAPAGLAWTSVRVDGVAVPGAETARAIADRAAQLGAGLIVLGTHAQSDDQSRLGSVSAALLELASAPVLLVPPAVWRGLQA